MISYWSYAFFIAVPLIMVAAVMLATESEKRILEKAGLDIEKALKERAEARNSIY